ncbi:RNA polymerase sigma factor SigF [Yinghuangia soli]|uniref:RNA polymerase sigma factor SigF n=1 Tax=Yinghuangia soli TaxID=2908204 RepID=A0AA41PUB6_9ACTN|nr:RNA polymerase sigma factor SigF [Yinghuangia soli]MCF2526015.1 RNA polymerase sigma factor SigF [Yinghuangia soli]
MAVRLEYDAAVARRGKRPAAVATEPASVPAADHSADPAAHPAATAAAAAPSVAATVVPPAPADQLSPVRTGSTLDIDELLAYPQLLNHLPTPLAREAGDGLLARLATLEPGTAQHSYVRGLLVELNLPMVRHAAGRYRRRGEPVEDIVQVGTIGLIKAIDRYEADRGSSFMAYAMPTIIGEIKRFFRDTSWSVRVPRRLRELRTELLRATDELTATLGRTPTPRELAERIGITEEEVVEGLDACTVYTATSLDETAYGDAEGQETVGDRLGAEDHELDLVEYREALRPLLAELPGRERAILVMRFYGNLTQAQIGERVGISQMHVSRLLARTLASLRERLMVPN